MAGLNMNRTTEGVINLTEESQTEIWGKTVENSAVMSVARQIDLPGGGVEIPIITGEPQAGWVNETDPKPVSEHTLGSKKIQGYTLAVIELFSNQFRRDKAKLYTELVRRLPYALAREFDKTVYGVTAAPGANFDTLATAPEMTLTDDMYADAVAAYGLVTDAGGELSHWLAAPKFRGALLGATDGFKRPLFLPNAQTGNEVGALLGAPVVKTDGLPDSGAIAVAGDFAGSAVWGSVEGVSVEIRDGAVEMGDGRTIAPWSRNMFAVRAEIEVGFVVKDVNRFVRINAAAPAGA